MKRYALLPLAALALASCGADEQRPPAPKRVELRISAPVDTAVVDGATVAVSGSVRPAGARVRVLGRPAQMSGRSFVAQVPLEQGANVIDVAATAPGRATALAAVRVTRDERIAVPDLLGVAQKDAEEQLSALGLEVETERGGGLLDALLPGERQVCEQDPRAGERVRRASTVTLVVAKSC